MFLPHYKFWANTLKEGSSAKIMRYTFLFFLLLLFAQAHFSLTHASQPQVLRIASSLPPNLTVTVVDDFVKTLNLSRGSVIYSYFNPSANFNPRGFDIVLTDSYLFLLNLSKSGFLLKENVPNYTEYFPQSVGGECTSCDNGTFYAFAGTQIGIMVNYDYLNEYGLPVPVSYNQLGSAIFNNHIIVTNPLTSDGAAQFLLGVLNKYGWVKGWQLIKNITANAVVVAQTFQDATDYVAQAKFGATVTYASYALYYRALGLPIGFVYPKNEVYETLAYVAALNYSSANPLATKFVQFVFSDEAQNLIATAKTFYSPLSIPVSTQFLIAYQLENLGVLDTQTQQILSVYNQTFETKYLRLALTLYSALIFENFGALKSAWDGLIQAEQTYKLDVLTFGDDSFVRANAQLLNTSMNDFYYIPRTFNLSLNLTYMENLWQISSEKMYQFSLANSTQIQSPLDKFALNEQATLKNLQLETIGYSIISALFAVLVYHAFYVFPRFKKRVSSETAYISPRL
jgi:ABC-type Fe3+ transport system substrate-binding protein